MIKIEIVIIYWWLLWGSLGAAVLSLFFSELIEGLFGGLDELFHPLLLFGTLSVIGGAGVLLTKYTGLGTIIVSLLSIIAGIGAYMLIYHYLVIPMSKAESSTAISVQDLEGKLGEVITTIPLDGMGEVFIESTSGSRSETAKSFEHKTIRQGSRVVVVEVKEHILYVSEWEDQLG